jgi:Holliday junction resolvasome RuvABC DNA-binding subunit
MTGKNKGAIKTQKQYEKEEPARTKIKTYFISDQMSFEAAVFTLRLLGYSATRAKQIVREWAFEKPNKT